MDSVCSNTVNTPYIQTTDLPQDTDLYLQDSQDPYDDLLSYSSNLVFTNVPVQPPHAKCLLKLFFPEISSLRTLRI
jgi:hypothetical protein